MSAYHNVLVAIDLGEYSGDLIRKALAVAEQPSAVHIVYVQQRMESMYAGSGPMNDVFLEVSTVEEKLQKDLRERLSGWADAFDVPAEQVHFLNGKPSRVLLDYATDNDVDLIVIGSRSQKGLQRLLGSTANSVVQKAACDVLAVRA
jgi:universal stress protein A